MDILRGLLIIAFLITLFKNTIYQLFFWQLKEYRLDRFLVHLQTWQGKKLLFGKMAVAKWLTLFLTPLFLFFKASGWLFLIVLTLFSAEAFSFLKQLLSRGWKRPILTPKILLILTAVFSLLLAFFLKLPLDLSVQTLIFDRVLLFIISLFIVLTNLPVKIIRQSTINQAKKKIENRSDLMTIGITGSYGKSSTKEFLAQILSQKFKVLKTPANINTDIGVAQTIVRSLKKEHQVFVCEMGAYKKREIKAIGDIARPKIGVITGINEQHLALFGSLEATMAAKFELIEALPKEGTAVFNGNNEYCLEMAKKAKRMVAKVQVVRGERVSFKTDLPGKFFLENILMAAAIAEKLDVEKEKIARAVKKLVLPAHTMQIIKKDGLTLIDDTYNSNPQGVLAALDYLKTLTGKKIFVFQPMIELGEASGRLHEEVGKKAAQICEQIFLSNQNFYNDILKRAKGKVSLKKDLPNIKKGAILFEGREAAALLKLSMTNH